VPRAIGCVTRVASGEACLHAAFRVYAATAAVTTVVGAAVITGAQNPAWARENAPAPASTAPEEEDLPSEIGLTIGQVFAGAGVAFGGLLVSISVLEETPEFGLVLFAATPIAVGAVVSALGNSGAYRGSGTLTVLGAYVGGASIVPLIWAVTRDGPGSEGGDALHSSPSIPEDALLALAVGWLVVQPLMATAAWHLWKRPKPKPRPVVRLFPLEPPPGRSARLLVDPPPRPRGATAPALTVPLLTGRF
jgi:hypothetical protein